MKPLKKALYPGVLVELVLAEAKGPDDVAIADIDPFGGRQGGDAMNHQKDIRARLFRKRWPAA